MIVVLVLLVVLVLVVRARKARRRVATDALASVLDQAAPYRGRRYRGPGQSWL